MQPVARQQVGSRPSSSYSNASRQQRPGSAAGARSDDQLIQMIRDKLASRGTRSIVGLGRTFRIFDDDNSGYLDQAECAKAVNDMRLGFSHDECHRVSKIFDRKGDGKIDYNEFLWGVRGEMNKFR